MGKPRSASIWRSALHISAVTPLLEIALVRVTGGPALLGPDLQAAFSSPMAAGGTGDHSAGVRWKVSLRAPSAYTACWNVSSCLPKASLMHKTRSWPRCFYAYEALAREDLEPEAGDDRGRTWPGLAAEVGER